MLQELLGLTADSWYGPKTREAHIQELDKLGLATAGVPLPAPNEPQNGASMCSNESLTTFAHSILDPHGVPVPTFESTPGQQRPAYRPGEATIIYEGCRTATEIAHEIGHYVMDYANGMDFSAHLAEAAAHFTGASWIKGRELYPGVEYAAHCVGNVLWGYGAYTKCPDATMRDYAAFVVARAG